MRSLHAIALPTALWLTACTELPLSPADEGRLDRAEILWANRGYRNYTIDVVHYCSCPPSLRDKARVEIVDGRIQRVILLSTAAFITDERLEHYRTVEDLFQDIRKARNEDAWERVTFSLDPTLGLPTYIHWAAKPAAQDLELIMVISNPQPFSPVQLPAPAGDSP